MIDEKLPVIFAHSSSRLYQNCLKKHFSPILPTYCPDPAKPLKFKKVLTFFEYVGNNKETLDVLSNVLGSIEYTESFLIIDDTYEGLIDHNFLEKFKNILSAHPKITDFRIYSSNIKLADDVSKVFNDKSKFGYLNSHLYLPEFDHIIPSQHKFQLNTELRKKKFLCVNRQERYHRLMTIDFLAKNKFIKDGYVSCPLGEYYHVLNDDESKSKLNPVLEEYQDPKLFDIELSKNQKYRLSNLLPLELDVSNARYRNMSTRMPLLDDYFHNSYFSIVTEGDFWHENNKKQFTEKVIKCFLYYHPFIVIGLPNTLQLLRDMGFMTFSYIIDESYDNIKDDNLRLKLALEQANKLCSQNIHQLKNTYEKIIPILEHNYKLALQYNQTPVPSKLVNEIIQWNLYN